MFGYISPVESELKLKDYEDLRAYYCGLCMCIKNKFGNIPRTFLNYDATFFAVLLDGLATESSTTFTTHCIRHPFSDRRYLINNSSISYAADLNLALVYYKVLDDILDDNLVRSKVLLKLCHPYFKKISNNKLIKTIDTSLEELHLLEKSNKNLTLDEICDPFAHITGKILKDCPFEIYNDTRKTRTTLYRFGYAFGKWIYLIDALNDLQEDMNNKKFNPICKSLNHKNYNYNTLIKTIKDKVDFTLMSLAIQCSDLLKNLPVKKNKELLMNIIDLGLCQKHKNISYKL